MPRKFVIELKSEKYGSEFFTHYESHEELLEAVSRFYDRCLASRIEDQVYRQLIIHISPTRWTCPYCHNVIDHDIDDEASLPPVTDDEAWAGLAKQHGSEAGCEWIMTRNFTVIVEP